MSAQAGQTVRVSPNGMIVSTVTDEYHLTRQARSRGMARLIMNGYETLEEALAWGDYARVSLKAVRRALDEITLEDADEAFVPVTKTSCGSWPDWRTHQVPLAAYAKHGRSALRFTLGNGGSRVRITAPCGETRVYSVKTLDRALTALGY